MLPEKEHKKILLLFTCIVCLSVLYSLMSYDPKNM